MTEVLTTREGGVLTITLNRPEVFNALNAATHAGSMLRSSRRGRTTRCGPWCSRAPVAGSAPART